LFSNINVSQVICEGTYARFGGIFNNHLTANFLEKELVKEF